MTFALETFKLIDEYVKVFHCVGSSVCIRVAQHKSQSLDKSFQMIAADKLWVICAS